MRSYSIVGPSYPQILHLQMQAIRDQKYLKKNSITFPKSKPKSAMLRQHLHSIYIVVGKISNLEMV